MGSNTKVVVLKAKELIYTAIFLLLGIILLFLFLFMFLPKEKSSNKKAAETMNYIPGVYTSTIQLGEDSFDVAVNVDQKKVTSVQLKRLNKTVKTMYPLMEPAIASINKQLASIDTIDDLKFKDESQYTNMVLKQAIKNALKKAEP